jgi:hypothetical protein
MGNPLRSGPIFLGHRRGQGLAGWCGIVALIVISSAAAQYSYNPAAADEQQPGIRYFGSAKDDKGSLMAGVTVVLDTDQSSFVFITDEQGRFRGTLPLGTLPEKVAPKCSKAGFQFVRVSKRPAPAGPKPVVQVDCVLRRANSG